MTRAQSNLHVSQPPGWRLAAALIAVLVLLLPLMLGARTPETLTASLLAMTGLSLLAVLCATLSAPTRPLPRSWLAFAAIMTLTVLLQVLPWPALVTLLGPYPEEVLAVAEVQPLNWSPNPGATLRGWAAFVALFSLAWLAHAMPRSLRYCIWLAVVAAALFQAFYGLLAMALGWDSILGIWQRQTPQLVHGTFSGRNVFAAYMALTWPLAVAVWHVNGMPLLRRLPNALKTVGSIISAALIGAAMLASTSRLGATAGVFGMLVMLVLWSRNRDWTQAVPVWPVLLAVLATAAATLWVGIMPLAERMIESGADDWRFVVFRLVLTEFPRAWFLHGVGLGGFEAVFKQYQTVDISMWWDYAHNDLLQWIVEMGLIGLVLLGMVLFGLMRQARLNTERVALYSGLSALGLVGLGDFSWHIPATQTVLALYLGTLLKPRKRRRRRRSG